MKNIWTYSTVENGLPSNNACDVVGGPGEVVYAVTDQGISSSVDQGKRWNTEAERQGDNTGETDVCVNQRSGAVLFTYMNDLGLGVKSPGKQAYYITEKDGLYSDKVAAIGLDDGIVTDDAIGPVYLGHYSGAMFGGDVGDRTISQYSVKDKAWHILQPQAFQGVVEAINRIRVFNGTLFVCADGALAISEDGEKWNLIAGFDLKWRPGLPVSDYGFPEVKDFYVDAAGEWYLLSTFQPDNDIGLSFAMKSADGGKSWDPVFFAEGIGFNHMEAQGDDLFFCSEKALRVLDRKKGTVKVFDSRNGLNLEVMDDAGLGADKFVVKEKKVYVPTSYGVAMTDISAIAEYPALWVTATVEAGLSSNNVLCIAGRTNTFPFPVSVFAGGDKGLAGSMDGGKSWKTIDRLGPVNLAGQRINGIVSCPVINGDYYGIATEQAGFVLFSNPLDAPQGVSVTQYTVKDGLASNRVKCALVELGPPMSAYLGHMGEGLSCYSASRNKWTTVDRHNGLAGNYVLSVRAGFYKGKAQLYACGYDMTADPELKESRGALSISSDGGLTWTEINQFSVDGFPFPCTRVYDVWCNRIYDPSNTITGELYGIFSTGMGEALLFMKSIDNGATWRLLDLTTSDVDVQDCEPKLVLVGKRFYIATTSIMHIYDLDGEQSGYAYWEDGLQGKNTGAIAIDINGQIYVGTHGLGVAVSNLEYVSMYDYYG
jgi:hypothetical protein